MSSVTHKKQTIDTADYVAVINTLGAYCQAIDAQDEAALVALFDEKAKLSVPLLGDAGEFVGSDGVKAFLSAVKARAHKGGIHVESNVVVGNNGSWFTNVSYWHAVHKGNITSYGKHEDLLKVVDGTAKFVSRKIVHLWTREPTSRSTANNARSSNAPKVSSGAPAAATNSIIFGTGVSYASDVSPNNGANVYGAYKLTSASSYITIKPINYFNSATVTVYIWLYLDSSQATTSNPIFKGNTNNFLVYCNSANFNGASYATTDCLYNKWFVYGFTVSLPSTSSIMVFSYDLTSNDYVTATQSFASTSTFTRTLATFELYLYTSYENSYIAQIDVNFAGDSQATIESNIAYTSCGSTKCFGKSTYNGAYQCQYPNYCEAQPTEATLQSSNLRYCIAKVGCLTCDAAGTCSQCGEGYILSGGSCTQACSSGYYLEFSKCFPCPPGYECPSYNSMKKCKVGYYSVGGVASCTQCPANSKCLNEYEAPVSCDYGEYSFAGSTVCTACPVGYYCVTVNTMENLTPCPSGYYCPGGKSPKQQCPAGYSCANAAVNPTACTDGYYQDTASSTSCQLCNPGYYCPAPHSFQAPCPNGFYSSSGAISCTICPVDNKCASPCVAPAKCGRGEFANPGSASCTACPAGFYCDDTYTGDVEPRACSLGKYSLSGSIVCLDCPAGSYCSNPATSPVECSAGFYAPAGSVTCLPCPAGKYCTKLGELYYAKASDCPLGTYAPKGSNQCYQCPEGYYCPDPTHDKILCHQYSYNYGLGLTSFCPLTPLGYNIPAAAGKVPTQCDPGKFTIYSFGECLSCPAGFQCGDPAGTPVECDYGFYAPAGSAMCLLCPAGYKCPDKTQKIACSNGFFSAYGEMECHACPLGWECRDHSYYGMFKCEHGYYSTSTTGCIICPVGKYCLFPELDPVNCPSGYYSLGGEPRCSICPAGFSCSSTSSLPSKCSSGYWSDPGSVSCLPCPSNYECINGRKFRCPRSHYSTGTTGLCTPCTSGQVCSETTTSITSLVVCAAGSYASPLDMVCKLCPPGYKCILGSRTPTKCDINTYQPNYGQTSCLSCAATSYAPEAQAYCRSCPDGYTCISGAPVKCPFGQYGENNACIVGIQGFTYPAGTMYKHPRETICPKGYYCPANAAKLRTDIFPCPAGTYGIIAGAWDVTTHCLACPRGYYCPPGTDDYLAFECPPSTYCPLGSIKPTKCKDGTFSEDRGSYDISQCRPNPPGFQTSAGSGSPEICPKGYYCPGDKKFKCPPGTHSGGRTGLKDISQCELCPAGKYCPEGSAVPLEYLEGFYNPWMGLHTSDYFLKCPASYTCDIKSLVSYKLKRCVKGKYCPLGTKIPVDCPEGTWSDSISLSSVSECQICRPGYICAAGSTSTVFAIANQCPIGYYCPSGTTTTNKKPCPAGSYSLVGAKFIEDCIPCKAGNYCPQGSTNAIMIANPCPAGYYCPEGTQSANQYPCPAGTFTTNDAGHTGHKTIERCKDEVCGLGYKCTSLAGSTRIACGLGTYNNFDYYSTICKTCPAGYKCDAASNINPTACPIGTYSSDGANACIACPVGYYCPYEAITSTDLLANFVCPQGVLCVNGSNGLNVAPDLNNYGCSAGKYCPAGATVEINCPKGTYLPYKGRGNITECIDTPAGYWTDVAATTFTNTPCAAGYYCLTKSTTSTPWPCPKGTFRGIVGAADATDCGVCPARYYCPNQATVTPLNCPLGSYCPSGTIDPVLCPKGTYGPVINLWDSRSCTLCDAGYFCDMKGMTAIGDPNKCDAGYYCKSGSKKPEPNDLGISGSPCPVGGFCPRGANTPSKCDAGYLMLITGTADNSSCTKCPRGSYCEQTDKAVPTKGCSAGYYCGLGETVSNPPAKIAQQGEYSPEGSAYPTKCARGYKQGSTGQAQCDLCSDGNLCHAVGTISSISCPRGYFCESITTVVDPLLYGKKPCPRGTYGSIDGLARSDQCTSCDPGKYCLMPGMQTYSGSCEAKYFCKKGAYFSKPETGSTDFGPCPVGMYCPAGTSNPIPCPLGTYSMSIMLDDPANCVKCPSGYYCNQLGLTTYIGKECAEGYYCTEGSTDPYQTYCPAKHYCPKGSGVPLECPSGFYQPDIAQAKCLECPSGSYCINGEQKSCRAGYYCP